MINRENIREYVESAVNAVKITDTHTHLYPSEFKNLCVWGPDELVTYHYLVAETLRMGSISYGDFWNKNKKEQADFVFTALFNDRSPLSESCRGILTTFNELGIDMSGDILGNARKFYKGMKTDEFIDDVFEKANIEKVVMTNDPFDQIEMNFWDEGTSFDQRFIPALRLDTLLNSYQNARYCLIEKGYEVGRSLNGIAKNEIRRFLKETMSMMKASYMAVSLPPDFTMPFNGTREMLLEECVIPVAAELNKPIALMIGVKKLVNPDLYLAGDSVGKAGIETIEYLCGKYTKNKFMVTMLSRENQHELCVTARKYRNLMIFGCWWFLNNPVLIEEITRMRLELLGLSFIPQHSDARVMDQLIYKWKHSRKIISSVLADKYIDLIDSGWKPSTDGIRKDVEMLFSGNFKEFERLSL
ncbi:MAG: glucuronate isomerase [Clostridia bacterium]